MSNKDWLESYSESGYPSFSRFSVPEKDQVFIRVTTKQKIKQSLILCRITSENSYKYIGGVFNDNTQKLERHF